MINVEETGKGQYEIKRDNKVITNLSLPLATTISNKFLIITDFVEKMSKSLGTEFDNWFETYITDYIKSNYDPLVIKNNISKLKQLADKYLAKLNVNYNNHVNKNKSTKKSIFFDANNIEIIIRCSSYLKLYYIICNDERMRPFRIIHKEILGHRVGVWVILYLFEHTGEDFQSEIFLVA